MRLVKHLVFKINDQKFAIKVQRVLNVIERAKIVDVPALRPFHKGMVSYRDTLIPLIDLREMLKMSPSEKQVNECVMVLELKINGKLELAGLSIDEICEITEFDKLYAYPFKRIFTEMRIFDPRDGIIIYQGEPLVLINSDKVIRAFEMQTDNSQPYSAIVYN